MSFAEDVLATRDTDMAATTTVSIATTPKMRYKSVSKSQERTAGKIQQQGLFDIKQLRKIIDYFAKFHDEMMQQKLN